MVGCSMVWFTHESGRKRKVKVMYIKSWQNKSEAEVHSKVSHPDSLMIWLAFTADFVSKLTFVEPVSKFIKPTILTAFYDHFFDKYKDYFLNRGY